MFEFTLQETATLKSLLEDLSALVATRAETQNEANLSVAGSHWAEELHRRMQDAAMRGLKVVDQVRDGADAPENA